MNCKANISGLESHFSDFTARRKKMLQLFLFKIVHYPNNFILHLELVLNESVFEHS